MTTEVRNGAQTRSVQNEPIQRCGSPLAASATFAPGAPVTTRRYLNVLAIEPGRSAPVHGASESAARLPRATSSATVPSCACSAYHSLRGSFGAICSAAPAARANAARALSRLPAAISVRP